MGWNFFIGFSCRWRDARWLLWESQRRALEWFCKFIVAEITAIMRSKFLGSDMRTENKNRLSTGSLFHSHHKSCNDFCRFWVRSVACIEKIRFVTSWCSILIWKIIIALIRWWEKLCPIQYITSEKPLQVQKSDAAQNSEGYCCHRSYFEHHHTNWNRAALIPTRNKQMHSFLSTMNEKIRIWTKCSSKTFIHE